MKEWETDTGTEKSLDRITEPEERSGDYEWETGEDVDREREELDKEVEADLEVGRTEQEVERDLEKEREEWEKRRVEMERGREGGYDEETGQPYPYPPDYFNLKVRAQSL